MSVKVHLPNRFYYLWEGKGAIEVTGRTVAECLDDLVRLMPIMKKALSYEAGALDPHIKVLVKKGDVGEEGLEREVEDGDEIHFVLGTA